MKPHKTYVVSMKLNATITTFSPDQPIDDDLRRKALGELRRLLANCGQYMLNEISFRELPPSKAEIFRGFIQSMVKNIPDHDQRVSVYKEMIDTVFYRDLDVPEECCKIDPAYDKALKELEEEKVL